MAQPRKVVNTGLIWIDSQGIRGDLSHCAGVFGWPFVYVPDVPDAVAAANVSGRQSGSEVSHLFHFMHSFVRLTSGAIVQQVPGLRCSRLVQLQRQQNGQFRHRLQHRGANRLVAESAGDCAVLLYAGVDGGLESDGESSAVHCVYFFTGCGCVVF